MISAFPRRVRRVDAEGRIVEEEPGRVVVFHHIPKTAGSTFRRILDSLLRLEERARPFDLYVVAQAIVVLVEYESYFPQRLDDFIVKGTNLEDVPGQSGPGLPRRA